MRLLVFMALIAHAGGFLSLPAFAQQPLQLEDGSWHQAKSKNSVKLSAKGDNVIFKTPDGTKEHHAEFLSKTPAKGDVELSCHITFDRPAEANTKRMYAGVILARKNNEQLQVLIDQDAMVSIRIMANGEWEERVPWEKSNKLARVKGPRYKLLCRTRGEMLEVFINGAVIRVIEAPVLAGGGEYGFVFDGTGGDSIESSDIAVKH